MAHRYVDDRVNSGLEDLRGAYAPMWAAYTRPLKLLFPVANMKRDIAHDLRVIPDGYLVVWATGCVYAEPGLLWTEELAYLRATTANVRAIVILYKLREDPINA